MTKDHLELAYDGGLVPAPDFIPGKRVFKPAREHFDMRIEGFRVCVRTQSLWKGTASAVPQRDYMDEGFSP
jgi:hypothetical protein